MGEGGFKIWGGGGVRDLGKDQKWVRDGNRVGKLELVSGNCGASTVVDKTSYDRKFSDGTH
jgi:hypothetical protein